MTTNPRFERSARLNRFKAICFTVFFHVAVLGGLFYFSGSDASVKDILPDVVKEWLHEEAEEPVAQPVNKKRKRA